MLEVEQKEIAENRAGVEAPESQSSKLIVSDLRKAYSSPSGEEIEVLRGVTFTALAGEALAIVGASGAGKSTLLHLLGGLETADAGHIRLGDFSINSASPSLLAHYRNDHIGFVFQFHHLLSDLSALENVALPLMIGGVSQNESVNRARQALDRVGLGARIDHPIPYLSGGEQQRVAVCRALVTEPLMVLADEPTGNLDVTMEDEISGNLMSYVHERGRILIVATHNERLARMCDRILILKGGKLQQE